MIVFYFWTLIIVAEIVLIADWFLTKATTFFAVYCFLELLIFMEIEMAWPFL